MSARLAPAHTHPYCTAQPIGDGAGHVGVYDLHTRELIAVHEVQPDVDALRAELRRTRARLIERTALVVACQLELVGHAEEMRLDLDHPLRLSTASLLRRIESEVRR